MSTSIDNALSLNLKVSYVAHTLNSAQRQDIAVKAVSGNIPISHVAANYGVSRKFVYQQKLKAKEALQQAFSDQSIEQESDKILFYIPVTKKWLMQVVLGLIFICRASYQGVGEFFRDILDSNISKGSVHNIVYECLEKAKQINRSQNLFKIKVGLHDEIYQTGDPVLVGCCAYSTYCYLLSLEDTCDSNAWGVHLLDLKEKQGLNPDHTVIDGGPVARKGQKDAWPDIPAFGDTFHALKPFKEVIGYLENRAIDALEVVEELKHKLACPRGKWKGEDKQQELCQKLIEAEEESRKSILLVDELDTLFKWLKNDILSLVGQTYQNRQELLKFVIEELRLRELNQHKIEPVRKYLENHSDNLLEFIPRMERRFQEISKELQVPITDVLAIFHLKGLSSSSQKRWETYAVLRNRLKGKFYFIESEVNEVLDSTVRANSLVENINSRLRTYFTLRRELGPSYLELLQFFLNHRRFIRSEYKERVGKSPAELLTGEKHMHWLEMLGFELFKQAA